MKPRPLDRLLSYLIRHVLEVSTIPLETILALESFAFGAWLLLPFRTFNISPIFYLLNQWPGEDTVGIVMASLGIIRVVSILCGNRQLRRAVSITSLFIWSYIDYSFWMSNPMSTAGVTYFAFVLLSAWVVSALTWKLSRHG